MTTGNPTVELGLVQMHCTQSTRRNLDAALQMTREAARNGAQLVCLPELFRAQYFCQTEDTSLFDLAESIPGPSSMAFSELACELDITVVISVFERRAPGLYHNTALVIDAAHGIVGTYRKMHIPDDPRYYEKFYFTPGDLGFKAFETRHCRVGTLVCWDQWFPEAARITALMGAQLLCYPTAIGWHPAERAALGDSQHDAWEVMQRSHAIANGCFVAAVNRTGFEADPSANGDQEGIEFWGQSFVAAPDGRILCKAPTNEEAILNVSLDLGLIEGQRRGWPFLRDRRIDAYQDLSKRFID
ncbi:MAG: N-carbamoylputrescine amidase [Gammaproteobacteria bacterium]|jgi:N-carbamoylputrescine amidase